MKLWWWAEGYMGQLVVCFKKWWKALMLSLNKLVVLVGDFLQVYSCKLHTFYLTFAMSVLPVVPQKYQWTDHQPEFLSYTEIHIKEGGGTAGEGISVKQRKKREEKIIILFFTQPQFSPCNRIFSLPMCFLLAMESSTFQHTFFFAIVSSFTQFLFFW